MSFWLVYPSLFLLAFSVLILSCNYFVSFCERIASNTGISPFIVGAVIVGLGTSLPEMILSFSAAWENHPELGIASVIGSNITNIGLCAGLTALVKPIEIPVTLLKKEFPLLTLITLIVGLLFSNGQFTRIDAALLTLILIPYSYLLKKQIFSPISSEKKPAVRIKTPLTLWVKTAICLVLLIASSDLLIYCTTHIANTLHLSTVFLGLTVVAIGTSLPELVTLIASTLKKKYDLALGSILGSNFFNLLIVLPISGWVQPSQLSTHLAKRDYPLLLGFSLLFWLFAVIPQKKKYLSRLEGGILLLGFTGYLVFITLGSITYP